MQDQPPARALPHYPRSNPHPSGRNSAWSQRPARLGGLGIALFVAAGLLQGCGAPSAEVVEPVRQFKQVSSQRVELQDSYTVQREFIGALQAPQRVELSFDASGPIRSIVVNEGDVVEQGQVLATLDDDVLQAELRAAEANRRDLRSRYDFNERELARLKELRSKNFASESRYDELKTQRYSLRAQIDGVAASILSLQKRIDKAVMRAPFAANISARFFDDGAIVNPGTPVLQLLESDELLVRLGMPVPLTRDLQIGQELIAELEQQQYRARILSIGLSVSATTNTVPVELELLVEQQNQRLFDGQIVRLIVPQKREQQGTWIPADSLVAGIRGSWDVYVLVQSEIGADGPGNDADKFRVERRKVNVEYVGRGRAYVSHGLQSGDALVDKGVHKIAAGQLVTLASQQSLAGTY